MQPADTPGQDGSPTARPPLWLRWAAPLQSLLLALALTWPAPLRLRYAVLGSADADTVKHLWTLWHFRRTLFHDGQLSQHTDYVNFPQGMELWPIEPLNCLLAGLLFPLSVVSAANLLAIANLALTGLSAALLGWEVSRSRLGSLAAGALLQSSSFALFTLHVGVGELQHLWLLPMGFWALLKLVRDPSWRLVALTGAVLGLGTIACFYYGCFMATGMLLLGLASLVRRRGHLRLLVALLLAALLAALIVLPVSRMFAGSYGDEFQTHLSLWAFLFQERAGQTVVDPLSARLQPEDLVLGQAALWGQGYSQLEAYGGGKLLAAPGLLLCLVALVRRPRRALPWLAVGLTGVALALGSYLSVGEEELLWHGARIRLPFLFLNRLLTVTAEPLNFPVRFLALAAVAMAALGALALSRLSLRLRWSLASLVLLAAADTQWRQLLPYPLPTFRLPELSVLAPLAEEVEEGHQDQGLLDLSGAFRQDQESRVMLMTAQMVHQHPIQSVPVDRLEFHVRDGRYLAQALLLVEDLAPLFARQAVVPLGDYQADFHVLRSAGFSRISAVSLGGREPLGTEFRAAMDQIFGQPLLSSPQSVVYAIPQVQASAEQAAQWEAEHEARVERAEREAADPGPTPNLGPSRARPPQGEAAEEGAEPEN